MEEKDKNEQVNVSENPFDNNLVEEKYLIEENSLILK